MAKPKKTYLKTLSPIGTAAYAWLEKPDVKFNPDNPKFKLTVVLDEGPEAEAFEETIISLAKKAAEKDGVKLKKQISAPVRRYEDDEEDKRKPEFQGKVRFVFKTSDAPGVFDCNRKPLPENVKVWNGDRVRVSVSVTYWTTPLGCGVSTYLNGVQLVEKLSGSRNAADDFDDVEGGYTAGSDDEDETL